MVLRGHPPLPEPQQPRLCGRPVRAQSFLTTHRVCTNQHTISHVPAARPSIDFAPAARSRPIDRRAAGGADGGGEPRGGRRSGRGGGRRFLAAADRPAVASGGGRATGAGSARGPPAAAGQAHVQDGRPVWGLSCASHQVVARVWLPCLCHSEADPGPRRVGSRGCLPGQICLQCIRRTRVRGSASTTRRSEARELGRGTP